MAGELRNRHRIITAYTLNNPNVIRLEPPLIVTKEQIDEVLAALQDIFERNKSIFSLALASSKTVVPFCVRKGKHRIIPCVFCVPSWGSLILGLGRVGEVFLEQPPYFLLGCPVKFLECFQQLVSSWSAGSRRPRPRRPVWKPAGSPGAFLPSLSGPRRCGRTSELLGGLVDGARLGHGLKELLQPLTYQ